LSTTDFNDRHARDEDRYVVPRLLDWVPGSHSLAYTTLGHRGEALIEIYDDLHLLDADSGSVTTLLLPGEGGDFFYAPDGQQIALVDDSSLSLINSAGSGGRRDILAWQPLGLGQGYHRPPPVWLPDARFLLLATANAEDNLDAAYNPNASATLWRVPVEGMPEEISTMVGAPLWSFFSPDRSQVAFARVIDEQLQHELHIAAIDNAWNTVYAAGQGLHFQGWLPDSSGFVFRVNQEAPHLGRLCQPPYLLPLPEMSDSFVRWIVWIDSTQFLFTVEEPPQLFLGDLDGNSRLVGDLRPEYFFTVGALSAFDFARVD
jgi:hypothetical protein